MEEGFPAWMLCEEILNKASEELVTEAIEVLHEEIKKGRISFKGTMITLPERSADFERDRLLINEIMRREEEVRRTYGPYIEHKRANPKDLDATTLKRIEDAERFLMAVTQIVILVRMSKVLSAWITDVAMNPRIKDASEIITYTSHISDSEYRIDALRFILASKTFIRENVFTQKEREVLENALESAIVSENTATKRN